MAEELVEAEVIEAKVIDEDLMIPGSSFEIDMSGIQDDVAQLTAAIDDALTVYGELLVAPQVIAEMAYGEVRRCEREVSSAVRAADELRRKLNRDYKVPLDRAKVRYDELMGPVIELHLMFKNRRIELDEDEKERKKQRIRAFYESQAGQVARPIEGQGEALVPFDRIFAMFGAKWLNKTVNMADIERELSGIVERMLEGERHLDDAGLVHASEAKAVFWKTLDVEAALARDRELVEVEARQAALAAKRAEGAQLPRAAEAPAPGAAEAPVRTPRVMLIDGATDDECRQIGAFCKSLGITGVFKGPRFYEIVKSL